jgi:hypothetical protein
MVSAPAMNNFGNLYLTLDRMTTPQQFLEGFLQEKTAAWAEARPHLTTVYAKYFAEPLSQRAERFMPREAVQAVIEDVKQSDSVASAVAREHFKSADLRTRYRLAASGESWKIVGIDHECFFCRGTGQSGDSRCQKCGGEGWYEPDRDAD